MPVGHEYFPWPKIERCAVRQKREVQHHLVDFCVTVSPHSGNPTAVGFEKSDDFFGGIVLGKIVSRAMIKNVAETEDCVDVMMLEGGFN